MVVSDKDIIKQMNHLGGSRQPFVFIIDFACEKPLLFTPDQLMGENVLIDMPGFAVPRSTQKEVLDFRFEKFPIDYKNYQKAFEQVMSAIHRGDTFLLNLTMPSQVSTDLSLTDIYHLSRAPFKLKFKELFVVFSPEPFVSTFGNEISTFPMKGTIDASVKQAEQILMNDRKEIAEHNTVVDLLRNDLNMIAENVRVERFRYIEKIKTHEKVILQTSSKITGSLPDNWRSQIGDLIFRILPAGSISGAPKRKTVEIINQVELKERGYFTGVFGIYDGKNLNSAVMIRFIEQSDTGLFFRSGGGITSFSQCENEYRELIDKVYVPIIRDHQTGE